MVSSKPVISHTVARHVTSRPLWPFVDDDEMFVIVYFMASPTVIEVSCSALLTCLLDVYWSVPWSVSAFELTRSLHLLPLKQRIRYKVGLLGFKAKHLLLPPYLLELLSETVNCTDISSHHLVVGSRPSDHYFRTACLSVCLCRVFLSLFDPIWIKLRHMLHVRV